MAEDLDEDEVRKGVEDMLCRLQGTSEFFMGLSSDETQVLAEYVSMRLVPAHAVAVEAGATPSWFGLVCKGSLVCSVDGKQVARIVPGHLAGDLAIAAGQASAVQVACAAESATILVVKRSR
eukprot:CAMPEP_0114265990 /NCGR_PEP_ID=MMETSP0058-20121206/24309_1 /TAXON_ID=36894 /ORGANISM="Pyramimonas parkeae, CCMP726" /LENGTH=121 /DNA_ID=CAMNT_0001383317 /DNA_START=348 /DNA_END=709 /DNA_ORIENTATION=-